VDHRVCHLNSGREAVKDQPPNFSFKNSDQVGKLAQIILGATAGDGPSGSTADVYQFLLEMAAHSARHTAQIREVKSAPSYPTS
jgi:hypothetical protein